MWNKTSVFESRAYWSSQSDQMNRKKIHQFFQRIAQKVAKSKKGQNINISTKLNLKTQNIYIKLLLKP
jgi:hypothetical protein